VPITGKGLHMKCQKLKIKKSFYFDNGKSYPTKMDYMEFRGDGSVHLIGTDEVGNFEITGELRENILYLQKRYRGKHIVYYVGRLVGNVIKLVYGSSPNWDELKNQLEKKNKIMGEIEFELSEYKLFHSDEDMCYDMFLSQDFNEQNKFRGICVKDGKLFSVEAKVYGDKSKVEFFTGGGHEHFKGTYDEDSKTFTISHSGQRTETKTAEQKCQHLKIKKAYYIDKGVSYPVKMDYLEFKGDGTVSLRGSDEVGEFEIKGDLKNNLLYFEKQYIGKHCVYYVGKVLGNIVKLCYDFSPNWDQIKNQIVNTNKVMAGIEFDLDEFKLFEASQDEVYDLFLAQAEGEPSKFRGLCVKDGKLVSVQASFKRGEAKIEFFAKQSHEKFRGTYDEKSKTCTIGIEGCGSD